MTSEITNQLAGTKLRFVARMAVSAHVLTE